MPSRKLTKEENQPSITTLLLNCPKSTGCNSVECERTSGNECNGVDSAECICILNDTELLEETADPPVEDKQDLLEIQSDPPNIKPHQVKKRKKLLKW